jgi:hypothetical protein
MYCQAFGEYLAPMSRVAIANAVSWISTRAADGRNFAPTARIIFTSVGTQKDHKEDLVASRLKHDSPACRTNPESDLPVQGRSH